MKIAVIGDGSLALDLVQKIDEIGGHCIWFDTNPENPSALAFDRSDLIANKRYFAESVERVIKKYLVSQEELREGSRFLDLFRVIIRKSVKENLLAEPEKVSSEVLASLKEDLEIYFDFDVVVDCQSGVHSKQFIYCETPIVGEVDLKKDKRLAYGYQLLSEKVINESVLIGTSELAAQFFLNNQKILKEQDQTFFWVSHFENPIEELIKNSPSNKDSLASFFEFIEQDYAKQKLEYKEKYTEWDELEDYMKAKIKAPPYPIPKVVIFSAHTSTVLNRLIDQEALYLSIEKPDFRVSKVQPENSELKSKTLSVNKVFVAHDCDRNKDIYRSLLFGSEDGMQKEPGLFFFSLAKDQRDQEIQKFTEQLFRWFSPKELQ